MSSDPKILPGIAPYETAVYFLSLLYPTRFSNDVHRSIYIYRMGPDNQMMVDRIRYSELSGSQKRKVRLSETRNRFYFLVTMLMLTVAALYNSKVFIGLLLLSILVTGFEAIDRRIQFLHLRREFRKKESNAKIKPPFGAKED